MALRTPTRFLPPTWLFAGLGVIVIGVLALITFQTWNNDVALRERGVETSARVTEVGSKGRVHVEYATDDGQRVESLVKQGAEADGTKVGDEIPIVYDPRDPAGDVRDTRVPATNRLTYFSLGMTVFALVAVPIASWRLAVEHRRRRHASI
ncbi:DUF3592 domain-containing protein [Actinoplanes sp. NPDC024001]|uniref:DUF3592 domain-containing protein n=1 Tax=Actinoplanes sp. NPDC024001 TaxID=3154598 RepID=UPI0033CB6DC3